MAIGKLPMIAAAVVIMIGRNRMLAASMIDSVADLWVLRSVAMAKSIIMMAFFFTMPISMIMPTKP